MQGQHLLMAPHPACHVQQCPAPAGRRPPAVRCLCSSNGSSPPAQSSGQQPQQPPQQQRQPQLTPWGDAAAGTRPPLIVWTQRGIPSVRQEVPDRPCPTCGGTGKVLCGNCRGKGRVNYRSAAMLPQGVWPEWCPCCRASGRWHCERCMGTGVKRDSIGFRLGNEDSD